MSRSWFRLSRFTGLLDESLAAAEERAALLFRAGVLLRSTERSLAEIANEVGYESDAALSKAFHRVVGMAPPEGGRGSPQILVSAPVEQCRTTLV